ncbi:UbiA prenyltransferase domain-containing protein 1 [Manis javanica]|nr:UbiA prenyltransferase domain-containing protein 1 [Manis javanica]
MPTDSSHPAGFWYPSPCFSAAEEAPLQTIISTRRGNNCPDYHLHPQRSWPSPRPEPSKDANYRLWAPRAASGGQGAIRGMKPSTFGGHEHR